MSLVLFTQTCVSGGLIVRLRADHFPTTNSHQSTSDSQCQHVKIIKLDTRKNKNSILNKYISQSCTTAQNMFYLLKTGRCSAFLARLGAWPRSWCWSRSGTRRRPRRSSTMRRWCWAWSRATTNSFQSLTTKTHYIHHNHQQPQQQQLTAVHTQHKTRHSCSLLQLLFTEHGVNTPPPVCERNLTTGQMTDFVKWEADSFKLVQCAWADCCAWWQRCWNHYRDCERRLLERCRRRGDADRDLDRRRAISSFIFLAFCFALKNSNRPSFSQPSLHNNRGHSHHSLHEQIIWNITVNNMRKYQQHVVQTESFCATENIHEYEATVMVFCVQFPVFWFSAD